MQRVTRLGFSAVLGREDEAHDHQPQAEQQVGVLSVAAGEQAQVVEHDHHQAAADTGAEKRAARPSRAMAAEGILVRENILFPSLPPVVEFWLATPVGRMGGSLTASTLTFAD